MKRAATNCAAILALLSATAAAARPDEQYGPAPDWNRYKELAEPAVRASIADLAAKGKLAGPESWSIRWPHGYAQNVWRHKGRFVGYLSCGRLVASTPQPKGRNVVNFVAVVDYDKVQTIDISTRESNSLVNTMCQYLVSSGTIPPVELMPGYAERRAIDTLGLVIRVTPAGAEIASVQPGLTGQRAGLATGLVISHVNGIALAGLGSAMANVLSSNAPSLRLQTTTGQIIDVKRGP